LSIEFPALFCQQSYVSAESDYPLSISCYLSGNMLGVHLLLSITVSSRTSKHHSFDIALNDHYVKLHDAIDQGNAS